MILGINTAQKEHELVLVEDGRILSEKRWVDSKDDVEKLLPTLQTMLEESSSDKTQITEILIVNGPGSFTSLRTGVAFANALATGLGAKIFSINTFEALARKAASSDPLLVILNAGGFDIGVYDGAQIKIGPVSSTLKDFEPQKFKVVTECTETQEDEIRTICLDKKWHKLAEHELQTLGESILTSGLKDLKSSVIVEPFYLKKPHMTVSSDPWKKI